MRKKEFLVILAITLIVALVWVVSDLLHTRSSSKNLPDVIKYLEPLDPNFDKQTLDKVSSLATPAPAPSSNPSSTLAPVIVSTPAPVIIPTPRASAAATSSAIPLGSLTPRPSPTTIP